MNELARLKCRVPIIKETISKPGVAIVYLTMLNHNYHSSSFLSEVYHIIKHDDQHVCKFQDLKECANNGEGNAYPFSKGTI